MFPTAANLARLDQQFPILNDSSPELQAISERYEQHRCVLERLFQIMMSQRISRWMIRIL
jgi:hypothetical protein